MDKSVLRVMLLSSIGWLTPAASQSPIGQNQEPLKAKMERCWGNERRSEGRQDDCIAAFQTLESNQSLMPPDDRARALYRVATQLTFNEAEPSLGSSGLVDQVALNAIRMAIELNPTSARYSWLYGDVLRRQGNKIQSEQSLVSAARMFDAHAPLEMEERLNLGAAIQFSLASVRLSLGNTAEALVSGKKAQEFCNRLPPPDRIKPTCRNSRILWASMVSADASATEDDRNTAISILEEKRRSAPNNARINVQLFILYDQIERPDKTAALRSDILRNKSSEKSLDSRGTGSVDGTILQYFLDDYLGERQLPAASAQHVKKFALLIGKRNYDTSLVPNTQTPWTTLNNPARDALELGAKLSSLGYDTTILIDTGKELTFGDCANAPHTKCTNFDMLTGSVIRERLAAFSTMVQRHAPRGGQNFDPNTKPGTIVFFNFSGHGYDMLTGPQNEDGRVYQSFIAGTSLTNSTLKSSPNDLTQSEIMAELLKGVPLRLIVAFSVCRNAIKSADGKLDEFGTRASFANTSNRIVELQVSRDNREIRDQTKASPAVKLSPFAAALSAYINQNTKGSFDFLSSISARLNEIAQKNGDVIEDADLVRVNISEARSDLRLTLEGYRRVPAVPRKK